MPTQDYRRKLSLVEHAPAAGAALGAAAVVFYLTRIVLQRTPLRPLPVGASGERLNPIAPVKAPSPPPVFRA